MNFKKTRISFDRPILVGINDNDHEYKEFCKWLEANAPKGTRIGIQLTEKALRSRQTGNVMHSLGFVLNTIGAHAIPLEPDNATGIAENAKGIIENINRTRPPVAIVYGGMAAVIKGALPNYKVQWIHKPKILERFRLSRVLKKTNKPLRETRPWRI